MNTADIKKALIEGKYDNSLAYIYNDIKVAKSRYLKCCDSFVEIFDDYVIVTENLWGKKLVKIIQINEINKEILILLYKIFFGEYFFDAIASDTSLEIVLFNEKPEILIKRSKVG